MRTLWNRLIIQQIFGDEMQAKREHDFEKEVTIIYE